MLSPIVESPILTPVAANSSSTPFPSLGGLVASAFSPISPTTDATAVEVEAFESLVSRSSSNDASILTTSESVSEIFHDLETIRTLKELPRQRPKKGLNQGLRKRKISTAKPRILALPRKRAAPQVVPPTPIASTASHWQTARRVVGFILALIILFLGTYAQINQWASQPRRLAATSLGEWCNGR